MRFILGLLGLAAFGYGALVALLYSQQMRMTFPASPLRVPAREAGLAGFEDVVLTTGDGERLVGWWKPPEPGRALILYFHGNGGSLLERRERARMLTQDGRGLLMVSYRGYSGSTGEPSEEGLQRDAEAAYGYLASWRPERIVLYGESLGSGVSVWLASRRRVGGIVLDSPFTSIPDVARRHFWFAPVDLLLRTRFPSVERIGKMRAPLLVLHGEEDQVVPITLGERLFAAAPEPKRFVRLAGVDHVSALEGGGLAHLRAFLDEIESRLPGMPALRAGKRAEAGASEGGATAIASPR